MMWKISLAIVLVTGMLVSPAQIAYGQVGVRSTTSKQTLQRAQEAVRNRDWVIAMDEVLTLLALKPSDRNALTLLRTVGPEYFTHQQKQLDQALKNGQSEAAEAECARIRETVDRLSRLNLKARKKDPPFPTASPELLEVCNSNTHTAASTLYREGLDFMGVNNFKLAAVSFRKAFEVSPGFEDSPKLYEDCKARATKKLALIVLPGKNSSETEYLRRIKEVSLQTLQQTSGQPGDFEFVSVISDDELLREAASVGVAADTNSAASGWIKTARGAGTTHLLVMLQLDKAEVYRPQPSAEQKHWRGPVVELEFPRGSLIPSPVTREREAVVTFHRQQVRVTLEARMEILDVGSGQVLQNLPMVGDVTAQSEWATFQGNEQAAKQVSGAKELLVRPQNAPPADELTGRALDLLIARIQEGLKTHLAGM